MMRGRSAGTGVASVLRDSEGKQEMLEKYALSILIVAGVLASAAPAPAQSNLSWLERFQMARAQTRIDSEQRWDAQVAVMASLLDELQRELNMAVVGHSGLAVIDEAFVREHALVEWSAGNNTF